MSSARSKRPLEPNARVKEINQVLVSLEAGIAVDGPAVGGMSGEGEGFGGGQRAIECIFFLCIFFFFM